MRQPAVIYTGAVYGAFKRDRGADIKNRLIYGREGQHMGCCVDAHNRVCVCGLKSRGGGVYLFVSTCMNVCLHAV